MANSLGAEFRPELVQIVGIDLDQTLYPKSQAVDDAIQRGIYPYIADLKGISIENAETLFVNAYEEAGSGSKALVALGFDVESASAIVQEALDNADLSSVLVFDAKVKALVYALSYAFSHVDLITGSNRSNALSKLGKIGIDLDVFGLAIYGDDVLPDGTRLSKSDGSAFIEWMQYDNLPPEAHLYIGDRAKTDHTMPASMGIQTILVGGDVDPRYACPQFPSFVEVGKLLLPPSIQKYD